MEVPVHRVDGSACNRLYFSQAFADTTSTTLSIVQDIQSEVNNGTYGLQAIKNAITGVKTDTQIIRGDLYNFKTFAEPKLDAKISSRATQTSVDNLQTTANGIDTKVTDIQTVVHGLGSAGGGGRITCVALDVNRDNLIDEFEISLNPRIGVNLAGCDLFGTYLPAVTLIGANLSGANLDNADLGNVNITGADFTGCHGTPFGTPANGAPLPTCS